MRVLGIDQSLSKCAFCFMVDGEIGGLELTKTGNSRVKTKKKGVSYYGDVHAQIHHICNDLIDHVGEFKPDVIVFESLSFGSAGNATRDLAELFGAMHERLKVEGVLCEVTSVAPTSLKAYARDFLKLEDQVAYLPNGEIELLKTGKHKKVKMDKKMMVKAVRSVYGESFLKDYNYSTGLDDLADATFLAHKISSRG